MCSLSHFAVFCVYIGSCCSVDGAFSENVRCPVPDVRSDSRSDSWGPRIHTGRTQKDGGCCALLHASDRAHVIGHVSRGDHSHAACDREFSDIDIAMHRWLLGGSAPMYTESLLHKVSPQYKYC